MERKKRTSWQERMCEAIRHLYEQRLLVDDKLYSFSGAPINDPLIRRRLADDNAIIPLGRCCEGGNSQLRVNMELLEQVEATLEELKRKGRRPIDPHLHDRTLFLLDPGRLNKINGQLLWQKPHFSARRTHTGRLELDSGENKGRQPDFDWDQF